MTAQGERWERESTRPGIRTLGYLAREFRELGGPPPLPKPTIGLVEGVELPLFYPGLNALGGPAGTAKSVLLKYLTRQQSWTDDNYVLVLDCETSWQEYTATMMVDLGMGSRDLDLVHYLTDRHRRDPWRDNWSGHGEEELAELLDDLDFSPSLVAIDSQSKSMSNQGLNENDPIATAKWYEAVPELAVDRWPETAVVMSQGRQKGWFKGMDMRQGRGSSAMLHEVHAQYMVWTKKQGSREVDGEVELICTKCRYGHRVEGSVAAMWYHGPSGFDLVKQKVTLEDLPASEQVWKEWLDYLDSDPRDPEKTDLPLRRDHATETMLKRLRVSSKKKDGGRKLVNDTLGKLVYQDEVECHQVVQPGTRGARPWRVWRGAVDQWEWGRVGEPASS